MRKKRYKSKLKKKTIVPLIVITMLLSMILTPTSNYFTSNTKIDKSHLKEAESDHIDNNKDKIHLDIFISEILIEDITLANRNFYQRLSIEKGEHLEQIGCPRLPYKTIRILLPYGKDMEDVEIVPEVKNTLEGKYKIEPAQRTTPINSASNPEFVINESLYLSEEFFPKQLYSIVGVFEQRGYKILIINLFPILYIPKTGEITHLKSIGIDVFLTDSIDGNKLFRGFKRDEELILSNVDNPLVIDTYREKIDSKVNTPRSSGSNLFNWDENYDYVIITNEELRDIYDDPNEYDTFQDLANYKNNKGIKTAIVTVEDIYLEYNDDYFANTHPEFNFNIDNQVRIREFIIDAYNEQNWGIDFVLLGGDADVKGPIENILNFMGGYENSTVPARWLWGYIHELSSFMVVTADLYYAGLDGTWNENLNSGKRPEDVWSYGNSSFWGEYKDPYGNPIDEPDLLAEVYVGRAPVDSAQEVSNFVRKTIIHEESVDSDNPYLNNVLLVGEDLGFGCGADYLNELEFPEEYNIGSLYECDTDPIWQKEDLIDIINLQEGALIQFEDGIHIISHIGHANVDHDMKMYYDGTSDDVASLNNENYFFGYSMGCFAGAFDNIGAGGLGIIPYLSTYDCIVERFITDEQGAFAYVANNRWGIGADTPASAPCQYFHLKFFEAIFDEGIVEIGRTNQKAKEENLGLIDEDNVLFTYYQLNLFGDPTTYLCNNINLLSPENTTYTKPMEGYFPATNGFENDEDNIVPENWIDESIPSSSIIVISGVDRHNKVVHGYCDGVLFHDYAMRHTLNNPATSGTVEFYIRISDLSDTNALYALVDQNGIVPAGLAFGDLGTGPGVYDVLSTKLSNIDTNTWYHIKTVFDCDLQTYDIYLNGILIGDNLPFDDVGAITINQIEFGSLTRFGAVEHDLYLDAIGFSWDPNYNVGDNQYEGLFVSFTLPPEVIFESVYYSLDDCSIIKLLGDTTIPMPENGLHSIQIYGYNSLGFLYKSNKRIFTILQNTPVGSNVEVIDLTTGISVTYDEVTKTGTTSITISEIEPNPPEGFNVAGEYFRVSTTATFIGTIIVAIPYDEALIQGNEEDLHLFHFEEDTGWTDVTIQVDTVNNIIYGEVSSLSIFAIMEIKDYFRDVLEEISDYLDDLAILIDSNLKKGRRIGCEIALCFAKHLVSDMMERHLDNLTIPKIEILLLKVKILVIKEIAKDSEISEQCILILDKINELKKYN